MREAWRLTDTGFAKMPRQRGGGIYTGAGKPAAERDAIASHAQGHDRDQRLGEPIAAEQAGRRHSEQGVAGVEVAEGKLVAHITPADLREQFNSERFFVVKPQLARGEQRRSVDQWHVSETNDLGAEMSLAIPWHASRPTPSNRIDAHTSAPPASMLRNLVEAC